jgi:hypothetical protein
MSNQTKNAIKKFKNGNVNITFQGTIEELEGFYNGEITMKDLYFHHNGSAWFMIDTNKNKVYFLSSYALNVFEYLLCQFRQYKGFIKFYPSNDEIETQEIMDDFLNG